MKIKPLTDKILVQRIEAEEKTARRPLIFAGSTSDSRGWKSRGAAEGHLRSWRWPWATATSGPPLHSPIIDHIEVHSRGDVRRAKLYYLRDRVGKSAKVREKRD